MQAESREALLKNKRKRLWNSKTRRKTKSSLTSSKTQQATRVAIKVIVLDAHHVHVFINHVPLMHREDTIVIRIKTRVDSALRALAPVYRVQLLSVVVIVLVTIITTRVVISLVPVFNMVSPKVNMVSHAVVISPVPVLSTVSSKAIALAIISRKVKVAISPVLSMVSRANTDNHAVAISPVSRAVTVLSAVVTSSVEAISPVSRAVMVLSAVVISSEEVISSAHRAVIASILPATIPMLNIA